MELIIDNAFANSILIFALWAISLYSVKTIPQQNAKAYPKFKWLLRKKLTDRYMVLSRSSMPFGWLRFILEQNLPMFIHKPLITCYQCMSSIYGTLGFLYFYGFDGTIEMFALHIFIVFGLNSFIYGAAGQNIE